VALIAIIAIIGRRGAGSMTQGETEAAGHGLSDEQFAQRVAGQTSSDLEAEDVFAREADGATTEREVATADGDDLAGE
jgi:hypothetical protein